MATTVHENTEIYGEDPREFNGFQWAEQNKEAVMTGPAHIVFGLGRFACPGRVLAINGQSLGRPNHPVTYIVCRDQTHRCFAHRPRHAHTPRGQVHGFGPPQHGTSFSMDTSPYAAAIAYAALCALQVTQPPKGTLVMVPLEKAYL